MTEKPLGGGDEARAMKPRRGIGIAIGVLVGGGLLGMGAWSAGVFTDESKAEARAACEQVALLRGTDGEFVDVKVRHISADLYAVTGTVTTPGLDDEEFDGRASKGDDGEYACRMAG